MHDFFWVVVAPIPNILSVDEKIYLFNDMFVFIVIIKLLNLQFLTFLPDLNDTLYLKTMKQSIYHLAQNCEILYTT